jgi:hypothetical protein
MGVSFDLRNINQPHWVFQQNDLLNPTRLGFLLFWKHFDSLFVTFISTALLAIMGLVVFIKLSRRPVDSSIFSPHILAVILWCSSVFIFAWVVKSFILIDFCNDPLWKIRHANTEGKTHPCSIQSANYEYVTSPSLWVWYRGRLRLEVKTPGRSDSLSVHFWPRHFRGYLFQQSFPIQGWVYVFNDGSEEPVLLGIDANTLKY